MTSQDTQQEVLLTAQGMHRAGVGSDAVVARLIEGGYSAATADLLIAEMDAPMQPVAISPVEVAEDMSELELTAKGMRRAGADRVAVIDRLVDGGFNVDAANTLVDEIDMAAGPGMFPQDMSAAAATVANERAQYGAAEPELDPAAYELELEALRTAARDERVYLDIARKSRQKKGRRLLTIGALLLIASIALALATYKVSFTGLIGGVLLIGNGLSLTRATDVRPLY